LEVFLNWNEVTWPSGVMRWWKDIVSLEEFVGTSCLLREVARKVEDGNNTSFWLDRWRGNELLCIVFPCLFSI